MALLTLDETFILSIWLEVLIYGLYLGLFSGSLYVIVRKRHYRTMPSIVMLCTIVVMFFLATIHLFMNLYRMLNGYIWQRRAPGGPAAYFGDLAKWDHIFKDTVYATQSIIGDAFAIFRCWVVWDRNYYIIAFPLLLLLCSTFSGYIVAWLFTTVRAASIFSPRLHAWITAFYSLGLAQNLITSFLIALNIFLEYRSARIVKGDTGPIPLVRIIVESAAVYAVAQLILMGLYGTDNPAQYIALEALTPTVGIVFTSITVRLALRTRSPHKEQTTTITTIGGTTVRGTNAAPGTNVPMQPLTVHIGRTVTKDGAAEREWRTVVGEGDDLGDGTSERGGVGPERAQGVYRV